MSEVRPYFAQGCLVVGCLRIHSAKGYCKAHWSRVSRTGSPLGVRSTLEIGVKRPAGICEIRDCGRVARGQGLCFSHYQCYRVMKHVDAGEYNAAYDRQKGLCAICQQIPQPIKGRGRRQGFHADHDHKTGVLRGLLCPSCNIALGHLHDDADIAQAAADYLRINRG